MNLKIERRKFCKLAAALPYVAVPSFASLPNRSETKMRKRPLLNAYYFRAHMYTFKPSQVCEDLDWMADLGTDYVTIALLEQDLRAAVENISFICQEAAKRGMSVLATPSRWGGLVAGAPKVPSLFSATHPSTWILDKDGNPVYKRETGPMSSVHDPATFEFYVKTLSLSFNTWNLAGVIWDEPETFMTNDHHPAAIKALGINPSRKDIAQATVSFFERVCQWIKSEYPDKLTNLFTYADVPDYIAELVCSMGYVDFVGCDGRPWPNGTSEKRPGKALLGNGERFLDLTAKRDQKSLLLVENHNISSQETVWMEQYLDKVLELSADQFIYYYYPRNVEEPDRSMEIIKKSFKRSFEK